jgi:glycosyltransferase involved in cell wall biosynthesis
VKKNAIQNIHFLDPIYEEHQVWVFHKSIDVLAHFRSDGETFGLNIAESMICGNPIITHKSKIWNAHLEYLDNTNSFVADIDNVDQYAHALEFFTKDIA